MITFRKALPQDSKVIFQFLVELAIFEKLEHEIVATEESLKMAIFDPQNNFGALVAEKDGQVVGSAIYFFSFSTFLAKKGLFLEDLYVPEAQRGQGIGAGLLKELAALAVREGCLRFEWNVLKWNKKAIDVYEHIGAVAMDEWVTYRMEGPALNKLALGPNNG